MPKTPVPIPGEYNFASTLAALWQGVYGIEGDGGLKSEIRALQAELAEYRTARERMDQAVMSRMHELEIKLARHSVIVGLASGLISGGLLLAIRYAIGG